MASSPAVLSLSIDLPAVLGPSSGESSGGSPAGVASLAAELLDQLVARRWSASWSASVETAERWKGKLATTGQELALQWTGPHDSAAVRRAAASIAAGGSAVRHLVLDADEAAVKERLEGSQWIQDQGFTSVRTRSGVGLGRPRQGRANGRLMLPELLSADLWHTPATLRLDHAGSPWGRWLGWRPEAQVAAELTSADGATWRHLAVDLASLSRSKSAADSLSRLLASLAVLERTGQIQLRPVSTALVDQLGSRRPGRSCSILRKQAA